MPCIQNEYLVNCSACSKTHFISDLNALPTSEITMFQLTNKDINSQKLKEFAKKFNEYLRAENYEIYKLYDNTICDIDIKTENLIQLTLARRDLLQKQINQHLSHTSQFFDHNQLANDLNKDIPLEMITIKDKLLSLESTEEDINTIIRQSNKLQSFMDELKSNMHFFSESAPQFKNSFLGYNVNPNFDVNFKKVKNLTQLLDKAIEENKVCLEIKFTQSSLRQEVFPLDDRLVKMYFTSNRTIVLESFDLKGRLIKTLEAVKEISSFPIHSAYGKHFVVGFTSIQRFNVNIYDSDLNLIQAKSNLNLIESILINEKNIVLFYENKPNECCQVYDLNMKLLSSFGQNVDKDEAFYLPKSIINNYEHSKFCFKFNSFVFGLSEKYIYLGNYNYVYMLNRKSGKEVKKLELSGHRPNLFLDAQGNVIRVNTLEKRITIFNSELEFLVENLYNDDFVCVHVNRENKLHFLDHDKKNLVIV